MAKKIRKGDQVVVLTGKDKGRRGAVLEVMGEHVLVESINVAKRHTRPNPQKQNQPGGIVEKPMPLAIGKVAIWNPAEKKADRIGFKTLTDGKKVRFFKSTGEMIDA
jgi:large subunit ribosomal protein L24